VRWFSGRSSIWIKFLVISVVYRCIQWSERSRLKHVVDRPSDRDFFFSTSLELILWLKTIHSLVNNLNMMEFKGVVVPFTGHKIISFSYKWSSANEREIPSNTRAFETTGDRGEGISVLLWILDPKAILHWTHDAAGRKEPHFTPFWLYKLYASVNSSSAHPPPTPG